VSAIVEQFLDEKRDGERGGIRKALFPLVDSPVCDIKESGKPDFAAYRSL